MVLRCVISYHNILHTGFSLMHGVSGMSNLKKLAAESEDQMTTSDYLQSSVLPSSSHEMFARTMRIKAQKTFQWLARPETVFELLMTCATVQPLENIMWKFMKWQSEGHMLDSESSPLAQMASESSPPRQAIIRLIRLMTSGTVLQSCNAPTIMEIARASVGKCGMEVWDINDDAHI